MALATAQFWGKSNNTYGMPEPFFGYLIIEEIIITPDTRVVTINSVTERGPQIATTENPFIFNGTSEDAINAAFNKLKGHTQLKTLNSNLGSIR
jgi:hypothetical protein